MGRSVSREAWLWTASVVYVGVLFATLEQAPEIGRALARRGMFTLGIPLLALAGVLALAIWTWRARPRWTAAIFVALCAIGGAWLLARTPNPYERIHLLEYGAMALLVQAALLQRLVRQPVLAAAAAAGIAAAIGGRDAVVQATLPGRWYDPADIVLTAGAAVIAVPARAGLSWSSRRRTEAPWPRS